MRRAAVVSLLLLGLFLPASAHAAFPGKNGKIAFVSNRQVWEVNPDGTNLVMIPPSASSVSWSPDGRTIAYSDSVNLWLADADGTNEREIYANPSGVATEPSWSPDGKKLAFNLTECSTPQCVGGVRIINADGSGFVSIPGADGTDPEWSPDGSKIAYWVDDLSCQGCEKDIYTIRPDGSDKTRLTTTGSAVQNEDPNWSPDGSKIVFRVNCPTCSVAGISTMNSDGTGQTHIANTQSADRSPAWSPDGSKIVFARFDCTSAPCVFDLFTMSPDGTGQTNITNSRTQARQASGANDWQPLPITYYPRPKGATPFATYFTVAYKPCASANEQHGAPLSSGSCSPPVQASDYLTVGTLDSNGQKANAIGSVRYDVKLASPSTPADVKLAVSVTDVRNKSDLSDYTGELLETSLRRITDKNNRPAPDGTTEAATVADIPFSATVPCAATSDTTIGSACALATTANALVPGQVIANMRAIWQLDQVKLYDGGADGQASTTADNTLFMSEGIFVP